MQASPFCIFLEDSSGGNDSQSDSIDCGDQVARR